MLYNWPSQNEKFGEKKYVNEDGFYRLMNWTSSNISANTTMLVLNYGFMF